MKPEIGTLVEMNLGNPDPIKMFVKKVDEIQKIVVLEQKQTGKQIFVTFEEFSKISGIKMDSRSLLKG